jgi:hypothetical protein
MFEETPGNVPAPTGIEPVAATPITKEEFDLAIWQRDDLRGLLVRLAHDVLELAYSLDYEIGGAGQTLSELADRGIIDLPTKRVTLEGKMVRHFEYRVEVDVPLFDDVDAIDHEDYLDEITDDESTNDVVDWELIPGAAYHNA